MEPGCCLCSLQHAQARKKVPGPPADSMHAQLKALELARPSLPSVFLPQSQPLPWLLSAMLSLTPPPFLGKLSLTPLLPLGPPVCMGLRLMFAWWLPAGPHGDGAGLGWLGVTDTLWGLAECLGSAWLALQHGSAWPRQSCSNNAKLLVILHLLQALSHLGDFVPISPLPGSCSACPRLTLPHLKAQRAHSPCR